MAEIISSKKNETSDGASVGALNMDVINWMQSDGLDPPLDSVDTPTGELPLVEYPTGELPSVHLSEAERQVIVIGPSPSGVYKAIKVFEATDGERLPS